MSYDCVFRGDLVLHDRVVGDGALGVTDGRVAGIHEAGESPAAGRTLDFTGRKILPGLVDTHVHAGSFETETMTSTTASAAAGGVTTIVDMPYDRLGPVRGKGRLEEKIEEVERDAIVDVGLYGTMPKRDGVDVLDELVEGGVCAFKFSLFEYDPDRFPRIEDGDLVEAFTRLSESGVPVVLHNELQEVVDYCSRAVRGTAAEEDPLSHGRTHPVVSETAASVKALDFAYWTGARLHLARSASHPQTFRLIDTYRRMGANVSGETCAHYLALSEDDVVALGPVAKVNPPIRDPEARDGLWTELKDGRVGSISTDHAPWPIELKQTSMFKAAAGAPGLETLLPAVYSSAVGYGVGLREFLPLVTSAPARIFGLGASKGRLEPGFDADIAVFDTRDEWVYRADRQVAGAKWSPFDGKMFSGRVEATYLRGEEVYRDNRVTGEPGAGKWLRRER